MRRFTGYVVALRLFLVHLAVCRSYCESARNLSAWTEFLRVRTRTEFVSKSVVVWVVTRDLAWLPPHKGRLGPKAFRRHRALRGAG